ncbi:MAG: hypothetical protein ACYTHJ_03475 [Planctomycetota bacterium]
MLAGFMFGLPLANAGDQDDCNLNGIEDQCDISCDAPGCDVPGCGTGTDCQPNGELDECEIAFCINKATECDDCNLNGIPDECDIADGTSMDENQDEVPDECIHPVSPGDNWTDDIWGLGKGGFPDNQAGAPSLYVTLNSETLLLDLSVEVESLRVQNAAQLNVTQAGDVGDLLLGTPGGMRIAGTLVVGANRTIAEPDPSGGAKLTIGPEGVVHVQDSLLQFSGDMKIETGGAYLDDPATEGYNSTALFVDDVTMLRTNIGQSDQLTM